MKSWLKKIIIFCVCGFFIGMSLIYFSQIIKVTDEPQEELVREAQEWIKDNKDQLPQINATKFVEAFQVWEARKFKEVSKQISQTKNRLFHDPFYKSLDNNYVASQIKAHELVINTVLVLWDDPVIQEALSDYSTYHLIWDDIRTKNLLSDHEVRALLCDIARFQEVLNDPRMRRIIKDPQVRAFYQAQLID